MPNQNIKQSSQSPTSTILIVGLGNPGFEYKKTRHNIGFMTVDEFKKQNGFANFKMNKKTQAQISQSDLDGKSIILAKPQTFMNNSGQAVKAIADYYKIPSQNIAVVHDDLALAIGKIKISQNCGAGGHKGVASITNQLKTDGFIRVRIGIKPQIQQEQRPETKNFVLAKFIKPEKQVIAEAISQACQALNAIIFQGINAAMNKFNEQ